MKNIILIVAVGFFPFNCSKKSNMSKVESIQEIKENKGKDITVVGTYKPANLSQKSGIEEHSGHYQIEINDTLSIVLLPPYHPESKRPADEVQMFEGKRVKVNGSISDKTYMEPPSIGKEPLTLSLPCFTEIKSIELE